MKVGLLVSNLEEHLSLLVKTLPTHSQIPVLSNFLLEANTDGFFIQATDLEMGVRVKIPAKVDEEGSLTVPGKQFAEVIASLPKDKIELLAQKDSLQLTCREDHITFQTIAREEFPNIFEEKGEQVADFKPGELKDIFSKIIFAVATDETRPELTGVYIHTREGASDFVATDGYRLSLKTLQKRPLEALEEGIILSSRIINEVSALKGESPIIMRIYKKGSQVLFENDAVIIVGRLIEGAYPPYTNVIPSSSKTKVIVNREEFLRAVKLSSVFARESANIITLTFTDKALQIRARAASVGEGDVKLEIQKEGEDNEIAFNVKFLQDLLRSVEGENVVMELSSGVEPASFKTEKDPEFLHIIMPVRVTE